MTIGALELGNLGVPMRTPINRSRTRMVRVQPGYDGEESVWDFGLSGGFLHVWQTQSNVGHLTTAQVRQLEEMEETREPFSLTTDLFGEDGQTETYTAYFDPETKPQYVPVTPAGNYWAYSIPMYLIPQGG